MQNVNRLGLLCLGLALAVGCASPTPKEVAEQASADVKELVRGGLAAANQSNNWQSLDELFVNSGLVRQAVDRPKLPAASSADEWMDAYGKYAVRIFTEQNVVSSGGGTTVFRIPGEVLCSDANATTTPSATCVKQIDSLTLRLKVTGNLDVALQVGPEALEPVVLRLVAKKSLAVEVNLDAAQKAIAFVDATLSADSPFQRTAVSAKGRYSLKLEKNGTDDYTFSHSVLEAVAVTVTDRDGIQRSGTLEARSPLASLRLEGPARRATFTLDSGRVEYRGLYRDLVSVSGNAPGVFSLAGATAQWTLEDGKVQQLRNVGFGQGQSYVRYGSTEVFTLDFNRDHGRTLNVSWSAIPGGLRVETSSALQLEVFTGFAALAADIAPSTVPASFRNSHYTVTFSAASGVPTVELHAADATRSGFARFVNGELRLSSDNAGAAPRSFGAPMCVGGASVSSEQNAVLDALQAVTCP